MSKDIERDDRINFVGHDGRCSDDAEAIAEVEQLEGGFAIELWDGRLVKRLKARK